MRLVLCGVRGSSPAPGLPFVRYGGHTSCIAVQAGSAPPRLFLDAGTGLAQGSALMGGRPFQGTVLLGHLHWDHTHGLPFFGAGRAEGSATRVLMPAQGDAEEVMTRVISPPHFPVSAAEMSGGWRFDGIETGRQEIEGFEVLALEVPHPGGRTFGYRVSDGTGTITYISDHAPIHMGAGPGGFGEYHENAMALVEGSDLLVHDAQYTAEEFPALSHYGHSAMDYAVGLALEARVPRVLLFHHDPQRTDDQLDEIVERWRSVVAGSGLEVLAAVQGQELNVPAAEG